MGNLCNETTSTVLDLNHWKVDLRDVIEYEWPAMSGVRWFLQEQISKLLNIQSFSTKYPAFTRRQVNQDEMDFLVLNYGIHSILSETCLGNLNAVRASEIHDLMLSDFKEVYTEYTKVVWQREQEPNWEKGKESGKKDNGKSTDACLNFNWSSKDSLQSWQSEERKRFWDIQTNIIQSLCNNGNVMKSETKLSSPYPASLISGSYQNDKNKFSQKVIMELPQDAVLDYTGWPAPEPSPPPLTIAKQDLFRLKKEEARKARGTSLKNPHNQKARAKNPMKKCDDEVTSKSSNYVQLSQDPIDCRVCSICNSAEKKEQLETCDSCGRGFHAFCVGLRELLFSTRICVACCTAAKKQSRQKSSVGGTSGKHSTTGSH